MTVTEHQRHQLLTWFEEQMDEERTATMIELLPPVGSDQLATKADLVARQADGRADLVATRRTLGTRIFASEAVVITVMAVLLAAMR